MSLYVFLFYFIIYIYIFFLHYVSILCFLQSRMPAVLCCRGSGGFYFAFSLQQLSLQTGHPVNVVTTTFHHQGSEKTRIQMEINDVLTLHLQFEMSGRVAVIGRGCCCGGGGCDGGVGGGSGSGGGGVDEGGGGGGCGGVLPVCTCAGVHHP